MFGNTVKLHKIFLLFKTLTLAHQFSDGDDLFQLLNYLWDRFFSAKVKNKNINILKQRAKTDRDIDSNVFLVV